MKLMNRKNSEEKKEVTEEKKVGIIDDKIMQLINQAIKTSLDIK